MRSIAVLSSCALLAVGFGGSSIAADDPMAGVYGNTVLVTNSKGETTKFQLDKDGTFRIETAKGEKGTGKWALKENNTKLCSTPDSPADGPKDAAPPKETCSEFTGARKAGDKWEEKDANGEKITLEVKAGM